MLKKAGYVFLIAAAVAVITLVILQFTGVWRESRYAYVPITCAVFLVQAYLLKESRKGAVFSLVCAGIIAVLFILGLVTRVI